MTSRRDTTDPGADMPDRPTTPQPDPVLEDETWDTALADDDDAPPPRRARRRLLTPTIAGLCAVLLATAGFVAGVQVQKGQGGTGAGTGAAGPGATARAAFDGGRAGAGGRLAPGGAGGAGAPTVGSVANTKGRILYVEDADGTTLRVRTTAQSKITRTAEASPGSIHPGDTVVVQGTKDKSGNLVATQITATSKTAAAAGGGGFGGGGGLRRQFGAPPGG
jgi:hypothetical protein